jgi:AAA family ATP:ADP antiporter
MKLVFGVTAFYAANIVLFALGVQAGVGSMGVFFYIWLGVFNMSIVALFWSYANDIYTEDAGHRLFPIIVVGMTAGTPMGPWIVGRMSSAGVPVHVMLYVAAALLLATGALYEAVNRGASIHHEHHAAVARSPIGGKGGFSLIFASRYIVLIAGLFILLNTVNTLGGYLLDRLVVAQSRLEANGRDYILGFYGSYYFWANIATIVLQILITPRLVKRFGLAGVLFVLPFVALGAYAFIAVGATIAIVRWAKTAENSTDYSIMNTARQLLWLPTSREEKYKAKQAADTFFVRLGDVFQGVIVYAGTTWLALGIRSFAALNLVFVVAWIAIAVVILRLNRKLSAAKAAEQVVA